MKEITPEEARNILTQRGITILDVRTPEEFEEERLEGAINIDFHGEDFEGRISTLDSKKSYLVHCKSGGRACKAGEMMDKLGFLNVVVVKGKMFE